MLFCIAEETKVLQVFCDNFLYRGFLNKKKLLLKSPFRLIRGQRKDGKFRGQPGNCIEPQYGQNFDID
jgi:hypothetical protein